MLAEDLTPGSNLVVADVSDVFVPLLPRLDPAHVLIVGQVPGAVTSVLADGGGHVSSAADVASLAGVDGPVDLVVVSGDLLGTSPPLDRRALRRVLGDAGTLVITGATSSRSGLRRSLDGVVSSTSVPEVALAPGAIPLGTPPTGGGFVVAPVRPASSAPRWRRRARTLRRMVSARLVRGRASPSVRRHASDLTELRPGSLPVRGLGAGGTVVLPIGAGDARRPPDWLVEVGRVAGLDWQEVEWAYAPPRGYRSQKPIFLLGHRAEPPSWVVKLTQHARYNPRLLNEAAALRHVIDEGLVDPSTVPHVVLATEHAGRAVVVESAWRGAPFRQCSTGGTDCPTTTRAIGWVTELGRRSSRPPAPDAEGFHVQAQELLARYRRIHALEAASDRELDHLVEAAGERPVPSVYFHGDLGAWNLLTAEDGTVGVLDWENATPTGPPLWDLLAFLRSYGTFVVEMQGRRPTPATLVAQLGPGTAFRRLVDRSIERYLDAVALPREAVAPLTVSYWIHQALKDASRTAPARANAGYAHRVLQLLLADPRTYRPPSA